MPDKTDLKKTYKELFSAKEEPSLVRVPELAAFAVDGSGNPEGSALFQDCVTALFSASYCLKFALKKGRGLDWGVLGLEGDWWCDDMSEFSMDRRQIWRWTLYIVQPSFVTEEDAAAAVATARSKKEPSPALGGIRFVRLPAHEAAHVLHLGPYDAEPPTIARLHGFIESSGLAMTGRHREIYLSDARRTPPERLRTIIRQPVSSKARA